MLLLQYICIISHSVIMLQNDLKMSLKKTFFSKNFLKNRTLLFDLFKTSDLVITENKNSILKNHPHPFYHFKHFFLTFCIKRNKYHTVIIGIIFVAKKKAFLFFVLCLSHMQERWNDRRPELPLVFHFGEGLEDWQLGATASHCLETSK